jgi:hypothetical protein
VTEHPDDVRQFRAPANSLNCRSHFASPPDNIIVFGRRFRHKKNRKNQGKI